MNQSKVKITTVITKPSNEKLEVYLLGKTVLLFGTWDTQIQNSLKKNKVNEFFLDFIGIGKVTMNRSVVITHDSITFD